MLSMNSLHFPVSLHLCTAHSRDLIVSLFFSICWLSFTLWTHARKHRWSTHVPVTFPCVHDVCLLMQPVVPSLITIARKKNGIQSFSQLLTIGHVVMFFKYFKTVNSSKARNITSAVQHSNQLCNILLFCSSKHSRLSPLLCAVALFSFRPRFPAIWLCITYTSAVLVIKSNVFNNRRTNRISSFNIPEDVKWKNHKSALTNGYRVFARHGEHVNKFECFHPTFHEKQAIHHISNQLHYATLPCLISPSLWEGCSEVELFATQKKSLMSLKPFKWLKMETF